MGWGLARLGPSHRGAGPHRRFHLEAGEELGAWRECCQAAGARGLGPIHSHRDGSSSFDGSDQDGNRLEWVQDPAGGLRAAIAASGQQPDGPRDQHNDTIENNKQLAKNQ